jgi:hypothetical protein
MEIMLGISHNNLDVLLKYVGGLHILMVASLSKMLDDFLVVRVCCILSLGFGE